MLAGQQADWSVDGKASGVSQSDSPKPGTPKPFLIRFLHPRLKRLSPWPKSNNGGVVFPPAVRQLNKAKGHVDIS